MLRKCTKLHLMCRVESHFYWYKICEAKGGGEKGGGGGEGVLAGRPAIARQPANHLANHHCFVHACLPHRPCSQHLKMMSPIHGVCGKIVWMVYFSG